MPAPGVRTADRFSTGTQTLPISGAIAASAARTTSQDFFLDNEGATGLIVIFNVTAQGVTPSNVVTIRGYDPVSNTTYDLLASAAIIATGQTVLQISPNLAAVANSRGNSLLPDVVVIHVEAGNATTQTYSISAVLVP